MDTDCAEVLTPLKPKTINEINDKLKLILIDNNLCSVGTFTQDTLRLIRNIQNGTLDDIIRIHGDLCTIVFDTVSAYSVWFVLHWFTYGASVLFDAIYIAEEISSNAPTKNMVYLGFLFVCLLYVFLLPCICAARITSHCAGKRPFIILQYSKKS